MYGCQWMKWPFARSMIKYLEDIFGIPGVQYVDYSRDLFMDMPILLERLGRINYWLVLVTFGRLLKVRQVEFRCRHSISARWASSLALHSVQIHSCASCPVWGMCLIQHTSHSLIMQPSATWLQKPPRGHKKPSPNSSEVGSLLHEKLLQDSLCPRQEGAGCRNPHRDYQARWWRLLRWGGFWFSWWSGTTCETIPS